MPWGVARYLESDGGEVTLGGELSSFGLHLTADAEQAKSTGGMVALFPRSDYAQQLAIPTGEPVEDLHLTLVFLGEDVENLGPPDGLVRSVGQLADSYTVIDARVMGHAVFNPDGSEDGDEPCAVYLVGDSPQLPDLHTDVLNAAHTEFNLPRQHTPWVPHITAGYNIDPRQLAYSGTVLFDRIGVAFAGGTQYFPLLGATVSGSSD